MKHLARLPWLPAFAVGSFFLATFLVTSSPPRRLVAAPLATPPEAPSEHSIAAVGLIEAASENIALSTPVPGLVTEVLVQVGDKVRRGAPLFRLDDRDLRALHAVRAQELAAARLAVARLEQSPRAEDLPPLQARVAVALQALADARVQQEMIEKVDDPRAIRREDLLRRRIATQAAAAELAAAQAELARVKAGAWAPDLALARAAETLAARAVAQVATDIERLTVRAPHDGEVLKLNVRPGEFAPSGVLPAPLLIFGDLSALHVRADVDEQEAHLVHPGARAWASPRGDGARRVPLEFVRIEPLVVPKRQLTGDVVERVDTRVLQVLYRAPAGQSGLVVGQQLDVFIARDAEAPLAAHTR
jgi:multidrug resistance efflux pump